MAPTCAMASVRIVGGSTGLLPGLVPEVPLVQRDVLDADDPPVGLELGDAIHQQERIAVGQDTLDGRVVEGQL